MRRIVLVLVLVAVLVIAGYMLLRPKGTKARPKSTSALTDTSEYGGSQGASAGAVRPAGTRRTSGRVAGRLKASTAAERKQKAKQIRDEERRRKKELRRQERAKKRMLKQARSRRGSRSSRKSRDLYVLRAVVVTGSGSYAMVDSRKVQVGDFVLGRRVVSISQDRIEIEAFGKRSTVRVGESLMPSSYATPTQRK
ncbi:hypothetical protein JXD38_10800 [candidate division WOR-3 bacterium]|nr:hypothetical protein [candidate division WOR-3 bacterium]